MAPTEAGYSVQLRLPRWDGHLVERLEQAGIEAQSAPDRFVGSSLEVTLITPDESADGAVQRIRTALRGWTVLLPLDFA